jgi:lipopolysaccharide export system protein LptA
MSAQRASGPARLAAFAAAAALIVVAAVLAVRVAGRREMPRPAALAPPPADRAVDRKEQVRHEEFKGGKLAAAVRGDAFFIGPDGRDHLRGAVEVVQYGPAGEIVSRLKADEVAYDKGTLRFDVSGRVRVEAGGVVLEGESFVYDKAAGTFGTKAGGRFASKTMSGEAKEVFYAEGPDEVRLGGGFRAGTAADAGTGRDLVLSGDSFVFDRRGRRGRVEGRAALEGAAFKGMAETAQFVALEDGSSLESAVLEDGAEVRFQGEGTPGGGGGEIRADRIDISFVRGPFGLGEIRASGRSRLSLRSVPDRTVDVLAPKVLLSLDRAHGLWTWSATEGARAEIAEAGRPGRALEGDEAVFDGAKVLGIHGRSGRPAVADSDEARIEAPKILVALDGGQVLATGGVACVLKKGEGKRSFGLFSPGEDVAVSSDELEIRPGVATSLFTGRVLASQGKDTLRADEIELAGDTGEMRGRGGVRVVRTAAATGPSPGRTIELGGGDMSFAPGSRTLTLAGRAYVRLPEARLEAGSVSAVFGRTGGDLEALAARGAVVVAKGRYEGRGEAASYGAADDRLVLTGKPVLTDGKGGAARGDKLTFDLADDKIFLENEGTGRTATVIKS